MFITIEISSLNSSGSDEEGIELTTYCDSSCSSLLFLFPHEAIKKTTDNDSKLTINDFANFFIFFLLFEVQN